jgi:hypothetical protein
MVTIGVVAGTVTVGDGTDVVVAGVVVTDVTGTVVCVVVFEGLLVWVVSAGVVTLIWAGVVLSANTL